MTTISIERLVSSYNNESMILDSTYDEITDLFCSEKIPFKTCYDQLKNSYIVDGDVEQILPSTKRKDGSGAYDDLIRAETKLDEKKALQREFIQKYITKNYLLGPLFGNTYKKVVGERKNTLFIFPTFNTSSKGIEKLHTSTEKYYRWIFGLTDFQRFYLTNVDKGERPPVSPPFKYVHTLTDPVEGLPCNAFTFLPVLTDDTTESTDAFKQRIEMAFDVMIDNIKKEARYAEGQVVINAKPKIPFTTICFMVDNDKDKNLFTGYYSGTYLSTEKTKILNEIVRNFIQRKSIDNQNIRLPEVTPDPMKKLNKDYVTKDLSTISTRIGLSLSGNTYTEYLTKLNILVDKINDTYKKTVDKAYAKIATAQSNISFMRLYYRVNNIDKTEDNQIKTGNDFLYKLTGVMLDPDDSEEECNKVYICKLYENTQRKGRYQIEVHKQETKEFRKILKKTGSCDNEDNNIADDNELQEDNTENPLKYYQTTIDIKNLFGIYRFRKVDNNQSFNYPGTLVFFRDLHTNERYKWFKHNDINGSLTQETQIKFYQNILFDKKSLIEYLKSKKQYDEKKPNLGYEFLKINEDIKLLIEYSNFIYNSPQFNKTHLNEPNILLKSLPFNQNIFLDKIKDSILDIIFQPNQIIYVGGAKKSTVEKKDTSQNYKVVGFTRYNTDLQSNIKNNIKKIEGTNPSAKIVNDKTEESTIKSVYPLIYSHLTNISHGDETEVRYCPHRKLNKCEVLRETFKPFEERMIAVVDITRDVHDASELKDKAKCKRLRKSIRLRMKRYIEPMRIDKILLGKVIGGNKKTKKRRRRH